MKASRRQLTVKLSREQAEWLAEHAKRTGVSQTEIVRRALRDRELEPPSDWAVRLTQRFALGEGIDLELLMSEPGETGDTRLC